ncbi:MAG: hypothetical protein ABII22_05595 [Candidatus Micrarchaeota archaeon]
MKKLIVLLLVFGLFGCIDLDQGQKTGVDNQTVTPPVNLPVENITKNETVVPPVKNESIEPPPIKIEVCDESPYGVSVGEERYDNRCEDGQLVRYYCLDNEVTVEKSECKAGTYCMTNLCKESPCYDSDSADNEFKAGTVTFRNKIYKDACSDRFTVREYSCRGDELVSEIIACDLGCINSSCVKLNYQCSDSDGNNEFVRGTVSVNDGYDTKEYEDVCIDTQIVREYSCSNESMQQFSSVKCEDKYFCYEGKCMLEPVETNETIIDSSDFECYDSDSGKDFYRKGFVTKGILSFADKCLNTRVLTEYYCTSTNKVVKVVTLCPDGKVCDLGRCK